MKIQETFPQDVSNKILLIPLKVNCDISEHELVWKQSRSGEFTTKPASKILALEHTQPSASTPNPIWWIVWNKNLIDQLPPKGIHFLCRLLANNLSLNAQSARFCDKVDPMCLICNGVVESVEHLSLECQNVRATWFASNLSLTDMYSGGSIVDWIMLFAELNKQSTQADWIPVLSRGVVILWGIWKARCDKIFRNNLSYPRITVRRAEEVFVTAKTGSHQQPLTRQSTADGNHHWRRPPEGSIKINVDAGTRIHNGSFMFIGAFVYA